MLYQMFIVINVYSNRQVLISIFKERMFTAKLNLNLKLYLFM